MLVQIIAVHADVELADRDGVSPDSFQQQAQAFGEVDAAALDTDNHDGLGAVIALDDLVGNAGEDAMDGLGVKDGGLLGHKKTEQGGSPFDVEADADDSEIRFSSFLGRLAGLP